MADGSHLSYLLIISTYRRRKMTKLAKIGLLVLLMGLFIAGNGFGADQERKRDRTKDQKKDGP